MNKSAIAAIVIAVGIAAFAQSILLPPTDGGQAGKGGAAAIVNDNGDLEIPVADITEDASFFSYDELDSKMEIIAVRASDGTIRTAFNTCQVCYNSGKGYYKQEGDLLICQNCGNQFAMDDVGIAKGGCNPVPITGEDRIEKEDTIIIPREFLEEAQVIFENWKL